MQCWSRRWNNKPIVVRCGGLLDRRLVSESKTMSGLVSGFIRRKMKSPVDWKSWIFDFQNGPFTSGKNCWPMIITKISGDVFMFMIITKQSPNFKNFDKKFTSKNTEKNSRKFVSLARPWLCRKLNTLKTFWSQVQYKWRCRSLCHCNTQ